MIFVYIVCCILLLEIGGKQKHSYSALGLLHPLLLNI